MLKIPELCLGNIEGRKLRKDEKFSYSINSIVAQSNRTT